MNEQLLQLFDYHMWANERVLDHLQSLPRELLTAEADLGFRSIAEVLRHIVTADEIWFARIREASPSPSSPLPFACLQEVRDCTTGAYGRMREHVQSLPDAQKIVTFRMGTGHEMRTSIMDIMQQVVTHGSYHRGNITTLLRSFGYGGVMTDYMAYLITKQ